VRRAEYELAWKLLFQEAEIHLSRSFKPSEILVSLDASSKPGASSVVGARRPCPYIENTFSKEYADVGREKPNGGRTDSL
jgi:hypothetical protein